MSLLNNEMEDVSRSTKSTPIATTTITLANNCLTATNPASAVEIVKQFNQNRSDLINNLKKVEEFYYYKNYYARNPNEIEIVHDKINYNHEIKEKEKESSKNLFNINNNLNKRLSLSTTNLINKLEDDNNYFKNDSYLFKSNKKLNYDNESTTDESCSINTNDNLTSSASSPISNNTNNNDNITSILDNDDNTSSTSSKYSTSKNSIASNKDKLIKDSHDLYSNSNSNSSTLLSNSNINEINLLRTGELVKNLRKKFSPDENNNAFLSYRKQLQQKTTNNNIKGNGLLINKHTYQSSKYNNNNNNNNNNNHIIKNQQQRSASTASLLINFELKKHKSAANILYENRAITTDVVRTNSTNNKTQFLTNSNKSNNLKPRYNRNIMIENNSNNYNNNNDNNNSEENKISKSKSNNFLNDLVNDKQLTSSCNNNIKNVESDVFENVHIKEKINKFMLNNNNDSFYSVSKNSNNKTIVKKKADRAIFGGSCNNLTALSTSQSIDSNQILNYNQNSINNHKTNDDLSNDSANSTFSDDSSLLENNNNNNKVSFCSENSNSENNMSEDFNKHNINPDYGEVNDNNKTGNNANNNVLFETINFDRVKFEENYNKIKEAFSDLRADNEFIESLLTDIRNKVKETYTSMEYDLYSLNDESLQLITNNDDTNQPIINTNDEGINAIDSKQTNTDLSSHDNEDYFYYTANSKKDLTENSNLFKSAATDADSSTNNSTINDNDNNNLIKKSLSILSSVSSDSTNNSTMSSSNSASYSPNNPNKASNSDRVVLIRHKF